MQFTPSPPYRPSALSTFPEPVRVAVALSLATADEQALFNDRLELQRGRGAELNWLGSSLDDWMQPILNTRLPCAAALERVRLYAIDADDSVESMQAALAAAEGNPAFVLVTAATLTAVTQWRNTVHATEAEQGLEVKAAQEARKIAHTAALAKVSMAKKFVGNAAVEQELREKEERLKEAARLAAQSAPAPATPAPATPAPAPALAPAAAAAAAPSPAVATPATPVALGIVKVRAG